MTLCIPSGAMVADVSALSGPSGSLKSSATLLAAAYLISLSSSSIFFCKARAISFALSLSPWANEETPVISDNIFGKVWSGMVREW